MDTDLATIAIAVVAALIIRKWFSFKQRELEVHAMRSTQQPQQISNSEIDHLRQELAKLRDTTTRYDMSVENSLTEIKQRLDHVESKTRAYPQSQPQQSPITEQNIRLGS